MKKRRVDLSGQGTQGLTHNPFAALRAEPVEPVEQTPLGGGAAVPPARVEEEAASGELRGSDWLVRKERKGRGGKVVTMVTPRGGAGSDLHAVARSLGQRLGTGARAKDGEIIVQGELSERVRGLLEADGARVTVGS